MKLKARTLSIVMIGFLLLAACAPQVAVPNTGADAPTTATQPPVSQPQSFTGVTGFLDALRNAGATVQSSGQIQQPYFPVVGQVISVNGVDIQVFEFSDQAARKQASDTISQTAETIGPNVPTWVDRPNFWAQGNLIVLYVGHDPAIIDTLNGVLGQPIVQGKAPTTSLPTNLVPNAQKQLANALNIAESEIQILSVQQDQWPNACLGLAQTGETCAQVVTPGWKVIVDVAGQQYEIRANQDGSVIRYQMLGGNQATPTPYDGNQGNMVPPALQSAQQQLINELGVVASQVKIVQIEQVNWPNACLGLAQPGETCAQVVTPGWKAVVDVSGQQYEIRANQDGSVVRWQKIGS